MIIAKYGLEEKLVYVPDIRQLFEQGGSKDCNDQIEIFWANLSTLKKWYMP